MQTCPNCGRAFAGDQCLGCIARESAVDRTFYICFPLALVGVCVLNPSATNRYPPLGPNSLVVYTIPVVSLLVGFGLAILHVGVGKRITRYSGLVILLIISITVTCPIPGGYFFLNGILDEKPAVEVPSRVLTKRISLGRGGGPEVFVNLSWNQQAVEEIFRVDRKTYLELEPGDSVRLIVHPGAFSTPWYSSVDFGHDVVDVGKSTSQTKFQTPPVRPQAKIPLPIQTIPNYR